MTTTIRALEALLTQLTDQSHVQPDEPILLNSNEYSLTALRGEDVVGMVCKPRESNQSL